MKFWMIGALCLSLTACSQPSSDPDMTSAFSKAEWITSALGALQDGKYPDVKAIAWWHENFDGSRLRIDSSPSSLMAYQLGISSPMFVTSGVISANKLFPPASGIYHSAFPDFGGTEDAVTPPRIRDFETLAHKKIVWAYFSNNWGSLIKFPMDAVQMINAEGKIPFIRMMPRSNFNPGGPDPTYTMQRIINGEFDTPLTQWAIDARTAGIPLLVEFGPEVNGNWFPWNGQYNGGGTTTGYGDPSVPDGPERFRDAYRHIIDICRKNSVTNITWFFHVDAHGAPAEAWNDPRLYYPGDDYIDWVGLSVYGPQTPNDPYESFAAIMGTAYPAIRKISAKPLAILEFGVTEGQ